jgi:cysteinyl-tRNA synthetase
MLSTRMIIFRSPPAIKFSQVCGRRYTLSTLSTDSFQTSCYQKHLTSFICEARRFAHGSVPKEGIAPQLKIYDSLSQQMQSLPSSQKALAWYTCGPTTYAPAHMGHARTYVCLDVLRRVMESIQTESSSRPLFVMNITDVDDKILTAAAASDESPLDLARRYEAEFWTDLDSLNCLRPHVVTRVTEYVESDIVPYIERLVDKGMAYEAEDGVYFHVKAFQEQLGHITKYGKLAPPAVSQDLFSNSRDNPATAASIRKQDPRDFVLWKLRKPGESLSWPSPWGDGRPGWHIECSSMIQAVQQQFQDTHRFLVHAGGVDLRFPHHTNEIAQAEAFASTGEWIPYWVHTGHLHIDGLKMSKSLKNFVSIREFLAEYDRGGSASSLESPADDFRLWCLGLSGSYRGSATFSRDRIAEARVIRQKVVRFLLDGETWVDRSRQTTGRWQDPELALFQAADQAQEKCLQALMDDLDGSSFVSELVRLAEQGSEYLTHSSHGLPVEPVRAALQTIRGLLSLVGFSDKTTRVGMERSSDDVTTSRVVGGEPALVEELVRFRAAVRQAALEDAQNNMTSENMKQILKLCDEARDQVFPGIGVEILDGKVKEESASWRFCLPRPQDGTTINRETGADASSVELESIPLHDFFRVGQYNGMFSKFSDDGMPLQMFDGSEVSKRMLKKLMKKKNSHRTRLERAQGPEHSEDTV